MNRDKFGVYTYRGFAIAFDLGADKYGVTHPCMPRRTWRSYTLSGACREVDGIVAEQGTKAERIHVGLIRAWTFPHVDSLFVMDDFGNGIHLTPKSERFDQWGYLLVEATAESTFGNMY